MENDFSLQKRAQKTKKKKKKHKLTQSSGYLTQSTQGTQEIKGLKQDKLQESFKETPNAVLSEKETPGNPLQEDLENFNHKYYERSMKIIDLLILGKDNLISSQNLLTEISIKNVFFEEPLDENSMLKETLQNGSKKDIDWSKQTQRRKFVQLKGEGNDTEQLYLIDANWIKKWINFVKYSSAAYPGPIINDQLYMQLDQFNGILIGEDVFFISEKFWNVLFDWYGGGPTLKWKIDIEQSSPSSTSTRPQQIQPEIPIDSKSDRILSSEDESNDGNFSQNYRKKQIIYSQKQQQSIKTEQSVITKSVTKQPEEHTIRPSYRIQQSESEDQDIRLYGLENDRLFCYLNSVLQCMFSLQEFREFYLSQKYKLILVQKPITSGFTFSEAIEEFAQDIEKTTSKSTYKVLKTRKFRKVIQKEFSPVMEHDSHEFLLYFINRLRDELTDRSAKHPQNTNLQIGQLWKEYSISFPSQIDRLFTVIEKTKIKCFACKKETQQLQYYLSFPLFIENLKSINQSLKLYSQFENLPDYQCENCKTKSQCKLQRQIAKLPEIFIFQLQRFSMYPKIRKIRGLIQYPEFLDMAYYMQDEFLKEPCNSPDVYQLVAVAVHMGTIHGGHYVAYARKENGQWYYLNDERVGKVTLHEVLNQDAYLLFYKKCYS